MSQIKNYITPQGWQRLNQELNHLLRVERPEVVNVVSWAAGNGDRSENGDYIYGKRRLREIDKRIRFLSKRLEIAEVVDPETREACDQIFFGATVTIEREDGSRQTLAIVGTDESDSSKGLVSWVSPIAKALLKAREGDEVQLKTPEGSETIFIDKIEYRRIDL